MDINAQLDSWAQKTGVRKLKIIRLFSALIAAATAIVLIAIWTVEVVWATRGARPTLEWFLWEQFLPWFLVVTPACLAWYFSDLALLRNHFEEHKSWRWW